MSPNPLLNASLCPYDPSCRLPGTDKPHLARRRGRTHCIVPRLGQRLAADGRRRQCRLRYQGLPGERRAIHEPQLQARHFIDMIVVHSHDSPTTGQSLCETQPELLASLLGSNTVDSITNSSRIIQQDVRSGMYSSPSSFPPVSTRRSRQSRTSRQRYWYVSRPSNVLYHSTPRRRLRSYLGYPPVRDARPNTTHYALAALQHAGHITKTITQNVDGLHRKAIATRWDDARIDERILELHGTLHVSLTLPHAWKNSDGR